MDAAVAEEYQSLYRKYRPQSPADVLGQEHVVRALVGSIAENRLAHAFLFCGPRGTGKTSTARILAKMVNCEQAPTSEPCGTCEQCLRIRDGNHLDVIEIDAASHGGVDDARELRERAPTAPAQGREKVYILDEAQRLSREAFDALLKLFEEPPPGVRFVLCTTEPHKMPATIVGRCQRFDFRRGTADVVAEHLVRIATDEGIALSQGAAMAIARQSEGSFRDALSLLDQASVLSGEKIDESVLESLLGGSRMDAQYELADAISIGDTKSVFSIIDGLVQEGQDLRHVTAEALKHYRNLLLAQTAPGQADLVDVPADEYERIQAQGSKFTAPELSRIVALLLAAQTDMRWTTSPRLTLELSLVRASMPETDPAPEGLISRMERLERIAGMGGAVAPDVPEVNESVPSAVAEAAPIRESAPEPEPQPEPAAEESKPVQPVISTGDVDVEMLRRSWGTVVERLKEVRQPVLGASLQRVTPATYGEGVLELAFPPGSKNMVENVEKRMEHLKGALRDVLGITPEIRCVIRDAVTGSSVVVLEDDDDGSPPPDEASALARLQSELDAKIADD
jgi:DNA polymerase-3 subunit gamma/tau